MALMQAARLPMLALSLVGGCVLWRCSRELWGENAAMMAAALWVVTPEVLAHGGLATVDLGATSFGLIACYGFWRWLRRMTLLGAVVAGVLLGTALLAKFTMLVLPVAWTLAWVGVRIGHRCRTNLTVNGTGECRSRGDQSKSLPARSLTRDIAQAVAGTGVALLIVNSGYLFQETCRPLGSFAFVSSVLRGPVNDSLNESEAITERGPTTGNRFADSWLATIPVPLLKEFLLGFDEQLQHAEVRDADTPARFTFYLKGARSRHGWWYYYLYAMLLKTPVGSIALCFTAIAAALLSRDYRADLTSEMVLWLPPTVIIGAMSFGTEINIGVRYVLPAWPFLILATARLGRAWMLGDTPMKVIVVAWFSWTALSALSVHPHYLSYFNELAGGPNNGWRYLADSNIYWGQDLLELKRWVREHPDAQPMHIAYAGTVDPHIVGLEYELPPSSIIKTGEWDRYGPRPGWFAVSVNFVVGLPFWTTDSDGESHSTTEDEFSYFRLFEPVDKAGYSIFIYHISLEQANAARKKLGLPELTTTPATPERSESP
jgi:hypothetical protein